MKKLHHILAVIAIALVGMFASQTAMAQSVLDDNDDPDLTEISTMTFVNPDGSITKITTDYEYVYYQICLNPQFKDTILNIIAKDGQMTQIEVYDAFMSAGLVEEKSWIISEIYKVRPHFFDPFYPILINE